MADVFYEVDEQLRSARLTTLFRRSWPYALGLLALVAVAALGVWAWRAHEATAAGQSSERYAAAMATLAGGSGDSHAAEAKFAALAKDGTPAYRTLALMQEAGIRLKAEDPKGAAALFDQAAAAAHDPVMTDGAKLRAAFVLMDTAPFDDIHARLQPLTAEGRPFRMLAREGLAIAELAAGRVAQAKGDFEVLSLSSDVSDQVRARANAALGMISSGAAANLTPIARAAIGLRPAPPPPAAAPGGLTPQQLAALQAQAQAQSQGQAAPAGAAAPSGAPQ